MDHKEFTNRAGSVIPPEMMSFSIGSASYLFTALYHYCRLVAEPHGFNDGPIDYEGKAKEAIRITDESLGAFMEAMSAANQETKGESQEESGQ